jgi:uncharacterized protein YjbI with pentapeptide repeats
MQSDDEKNWRPAEILQRYLAGDRDFRSITMQGPEATHDTSFRGANLSGADFGGSWIDYVDFTGATLVGARFPVAHVKCCTFDGADLRDADFSEAGIDAATFEGADIAGANFDGATAYGYVFKKGEHP